MANISPLQQAGFQKPFSQTLKFDF